MKTIFGTVAVAALGLVVLTTTAHEACAQAAATPPAQAPAGKKAKQVKDTGEYDIFNDVVKDSQANPPNGKKFLADLDTWTQKYPNTEFKDRRIMYYVLAYSADNQAGKAVDAAKPLIDEGLDGMKAGLDEDQIVLQALFQTARAAAALAATGSPTPDEIATGMKASELLAEFGKTYFAPDKKPGNMTADQWAAGLKQVEDLAKATQFQISVAPAAAALKANPNDPATCAAAEPMFLSVLNHYPDSGIISNQLAAISRCQQTKDPTKVQQALYYWARATVDPVGGVGELDTAGQKTLDDYLKRVYTTIHGSDEGLADLKTLAGKSPTPPADFKVKTASEVAAAKEEEFRTKNPRLAMWMSIKGQLADTNGQQYFDDQLKEHDMSGANGDKLLRGVIVEGKPSSCRPKELLVAVPMPDATGTPVAEITLKIEPPLTGKVEPGGEIFFNGVPSAFSKDPFMLTMDTSKDKIDGLTLTPCAAGRAPVGRAPAPKKKGE
ncbi:MAG TPA: hypothetical protein VHW09_22185 [Bryobacteraceae bacterium]|jgi:hypothetical protein|nr:hypothetical protein [Bryobacteraceae bacterium]